MEARDPYNFFMADNPATSQPRPTPVYRHLILAAIVFALVLTALLAPRIDQPGDYNHWVDTRTLLGIPNAGDVISNLGFLWVGLLGLRALAARRCRCDLPGETLAWLLVFTGVTLTALGSAYYHWAPDNARLTWDRLPMALGFMALLSALLIERIGPRAGLALLPLLIVCGGGSVGYWYWTDLQGAGDLRPYLLTQGGTLLLIPASLLLYSPTYDRGGDYLIALGFYGLALLTEHLDRAIFEFTGVISGHSIKHLLAAVAVYWLLRMLQRRRRLQQNS
jgi:hypothetical protein